MRLWYDAFNDVLMIAVDKGIADMAKYLKECQYNNHVTRLQDEVYEGRNRSNEIVYQRTSEIEDKGIYFSLFGNAYLR